MAARLCDICKSTRVGYGYQVRDVCMDGYVLVAAFRCC